MPLTRFVVTWAPGTWPTLPASFSTASGLSGSAPGRSLASGVITTGLPVSPAITSGSATGGTPSRSPGSCTRKSRLSVTGAPSPSVTSYSTFTSPPWPGAWKRTAPAPVTRASAPASAPDWGRAATVETASPSCGSRQSASTGTSIVPLAGTVHTRGSKWSRRLRLGVLGVGRHDGDADGGVRRDRLAAVVDEVLEAGAGGRVARQGDLDGLAVGADRQPRVGPGDGAHRADRQQPVRRRGVVVERVQDRGAAGSRPEAVVLGLGRPAVALVLLVLVVVVVLVLRPQVEGVPVVQLRRLVGVHVPHVAAGPVVEDDLPAVDAEDQVRRLRVERLRGPFGTTARR